MINVKIDVNNKIESEIHIEGITQDCVREGSIALLEICNGIAEAAGKTFESTFEEVVRCAMVLRFFRSKEQEHEDRT